MRQRLRRDSMKDEKCEDDVRPGVSLMINIKQNIDRRARRAIYRFSGNTAALAIFEEENAITGFAFISLNFMNHCAGGSIAEARDTRVHHRWTGRQSFPLRKP